MLLAIILTLVVIALVLARSDEAAAHWQPGAHNVQHAVRDAFGSRWREAMHVAWCESRFKTWATNGQYRGLFQMGSHERAIYGHGPDPWSQARAAARYWRATGRDWSPWDWRCRP